MYLHFNGRYSRTSSRRERTPSKITEIRKDSQKDVDCSVKSICTDWTCSNWFMPRENDMLMVQYVYKYFIYTLLKIGLGLIMCNNNYSRCIVVFIFEL